MTSEDFWSSVGHGCGKWQLIQLDPDGIVCQGDDALFPGLLGKRFVDQLAAQSRARFRDLLACPVGEPCGDVLNTEDGVALELVPLPASAPQRRAFYCRRLAAASGAFPRLDFFYRHFTTSEMGICITDPSGHIVDANPYFLNFYGYSSEEVLGCNPRILKSGRQSPDSYREIWQKITDPETGHWSGEMINRRKNAEEVIVHLTISAVRNASGEIAGFVGSTVDMTARKQLERELRANNEELLELNQLKTDLMAITSHDLKSPLNAIISRARMLLDLGEEFSAEKRQNALVKIVESGEKMGRFINELLDLEKMESGRYQLYSARLHLDTVLSGCVDTNLPTATEKGVRIILRQEGASRPLRADSLKLEQAFNNIISNAIRYTPPGGSITITCQDTPGKPRRVTISDTGPGIPEKDLPFIFDRYYQARFKGGIAARVFGAGLGLSIVKKIVELHDGNVWAGNGPCGGCVFTIEVPEHRKAVSGHDLAAIIIDPHQEIYNWLEAPLKKAGVSCFIARNLFEARRIVERERPEMVFAEPASLTDQLRRFLGKLNGGVRRISVGAVAGVVEDPFYHQELLTPVIDIELFELIEDVLNDLVATEVT